MFVSGHQPVSSVRFAGGSQSGLIQAQHGEGHASAFIRSLQQQQGLRYNAPVIKTLSKDEFEQVRSQSYQLQRYSDLKVDFDKQAVILVYPAQWTGTGSARLVAKSASYDAQEGLSLKMQIKYPSGAATADMGSPWALVVVDKKFADKPPTFEMVNSGPFAG